MLFYIIPPSISLFPQKSVAIVLELQLLFIKLIQRLPAYSQSDHGFTVPTEPPKEEKKTPPVLLTLINLPPCLPSYKK